MGRKKGSRRVTALYERLFRDDELRGEFAADRRGLRTRVGVRRNA